GVKAVSPTPLTPKDKREETDLYNEMNTWPAKRSRDGKPAFAMPLEDASRDPDILALDTITMLEYARRKGWGERALANVENWSTSDIGGTSSEVSAYAFLAFNSLGQGGEDIHLPGDSAWLAAAVQDRGRR